MTIEIKLPIKCGTITKITNMLDAITNVFDALIILIPIIIVFGLIGFVMGLSLNACVYAPYLFGKIAGAICLCICIFFTYGFLDLIFNFKITCIKD